MSQICQNIAEVQRELEGTNCRLVAVSKTKPNEQLQEAYHCGQRIFGENKVQELTDKIEALPADMEWHMIGHLQRNKVKYLVGKVALLHGIDSLRLLKEVDKRAKAAEVIQPCLLQMHIAEEDTKFGLDQAELEELLTSEELKQMENVQLRGLMGMATHTANMERVRKEFKGLANTFRQLQQQHPLPNAQWQELSMGMSNDWRVAVEEGSTLVRLGSSIFGARK
jgi:pyridoxal phosphate enzyme (YggS family)